MISNRIAALLFLSSSLFFVWSACHGHDAFAGWLERTFDRRFISQSAPARTDVFGVRIAFGDDNETLRISYSTNVELRSKPCVRMRWNVENGIEDLWGNRKISLDRSDENLNGEEPKRVENTSLSPPSSIQRNKGKEQRKAPRREEEEETVGEGIMICGSSRRFIEPSLNRCSHVVHVIEVPRDRMPQAGSVVRYQCGNDDDGWRDRWLTMIVPASPSDGSASVLLFGDMGADNHAITLSDLQRDIERSFRNHDAVDDGDGLCVNRERAEAYSAALHIGDIAYDLRDYHGDHAKKFLKMVEPVSSVIPYMVSPGNHEEGWNFSHYRSLFTMPAWSRTENLHYSFDVGPLHIISINAEIFYWSESFSRDHMQRMYDWLNDDLEKVRRDGNNEKWVLVVGHRPMYCARPKAKAGKKGAGWNRSHRLTRGHHQKQTADSQLREEKGALEVGAGAKRERSSQYGQCDYEQEALRLGIPSDCPRDNPKACRPVRANDTGNQRWPMEELLKRYRVDLYVAGHVHCYVRFHPTYKYDVDEHAVRRSNREEKQGHSVDDVFGAGNDGCSGISHSASVSVPDVYYDPKYPVHVISGAGGTSLYECENHHEGP